MTFIKHYVSNTRFSTFDAVAAHYEAVKPIISKLHTREDDIRPLHERRYKHERIMKIDENTYGFSDGWYDTMGGSSNRPFTEEYFQAHLPIVWSRDANGDTFIRVRNGAGKYGHAGRYMFLSVFLPQGLRFEGDSKGKQYVFANTPTDTYPQKYTLPKSMYTWDWSGQKPSLDQDDKMYLTFKVLPNNRYVRVGELLIVQSTHVDREAKKALKPKLEAYYAWLSIMAPLLPRGYSESKDAAERINNHEGREIFSHVWAAFASDFTLETEMFVLDVLSDEEHPMRTAFGSILVTKMLHKKYGSNEVTPQIARTRYNTAMNKMLNLFKPVAV